MIICKNPKKVMGTFSISKCASRCTRAISTESLESSIGKKLIKHIVNNYDSKLINTPTISITDPSPNVSSLSISSTEYDSDWLMSGLNCKPNLSSTEILKLSKSQDPFKLVEKDISKLADGIKELLGSDHPVLETCAKYFFEIDGGKKIRPTMVLAMSYALNFTSNDSDVICLSNNSNSNKNSFNHSNSSLYHASSSQTRLAEITEMIHTASLFHDDVIDKASTRRGVPSVNQVFGNKLAILGGDFLLARASISLARLRNIEVVELLSTVIEHLVKGEIMQMRPSQTHGTAIDNYMLKNFYKTASLMGNSCLASAVLGGYDHNIQKACYLYGTYVGQAFQLIDDVLDFEGSVLSLGKAPLADLKSGIATAPTLFAAEKFPQLNTLISRKFEAPGDVEEAVSLVSCSDGIVRCRNLAQVHVEKALEQLKLLKPSAARDALMALACKVLTRSS